MASVSQGDLVYSVLNDGLMDQAPLFGQVIDHSGLFATATVSVQVENTGQFQSYTRDDTANKLVVYTADGDAASIRGLKRRATLASGVKIIGHVMRSFTVASVRTVLLCVSEIEHNGPRLTILMKPQYAVVPYTSTEHWY